MDDILTEKYKMTFDEIYKNKVYSVLSEFESVRKRKLVYYLHLYIFLLLFFLFILQNI